MQSPVEYGTPLTKDGFQTAYWSTAQLNDRETVICMMWTLNIFCAAVVHPDTGETVTQYKKLANDPNNAELRELWCTGFGKEVGRMAQGDDKTNTPGTNCMFVMSHAQIAKMHAEGRVPTYARVVVDV